MSCDAENVGVESSVKDDTRSPVAFDFDDIVCEHSVCALNGRRRDFNGQYEE